MPYTHTHSQAVTRSGLELVSARFDLTGDQEINLEEDLAANQTNLEFTLGLDVSKLKSYVLVATAAVTLKTNSTGSPDDTILLPAGKAVVWYDGSPYANLFGTDVTKVYLTNTAAASVKLSFLVDN